jgi:Mn-dependent DtxR family transcriptional regulator
MAQVTEFMGVQRSTVSTVVRALQTQELITPQRGGTIVLDRSGLEDIACERYGKIRQTFARLLPVPSSWV